MLSLIRHRKCKTRKERDRERLAVATEPAAMDVEERPSSRASSGGSERPSSRTGRSKQPILGTLGFGNTPNLFDDDPGVMSEVDTSSSRIRRGAKDRNSYGGSVATRPRTSPSQPSRSPGPGGGSNHSNAKVCHNNNNYYLDGDEDPGIMSEAETSSTSTRIKRGSIGPLPPLPCIPGSRGRSGQSGYFISPGQQQHMIDSSMFDDDPGIMSEADTSSTGRRKVLAKAPLPVVRTPSKTLERPLGLVFLVYRGETKRALLPNEITTIDTVKALFVRSFGRALTMEYLDSPRVRIYIHDSAKDIFYELENLSEVKDRTILKLFETDQTGRGPSGLGPGGLPPFTPTPFEAGENYSAEPEYITSEYVRDQKRAQKQLDMATSFPPNIASQGSNIVSSTLPRNTFSSRDFAPSEAVNGKVKSGASAVRISSSHSSNTNQTRTMPGRSKTLGAGFMRGVQGSKFESGYASSPDGGNQDCEPVAGKKQFSSRFGGIGDGFHSGPGPVNAAEAKERMIAMETQLNQLTGMVQKALNNKKAASKKTVSFEKAVSFSDDTPQGILSKKGSGGDRFSSRGGGPDGRGSVRSNTDRRPDRSSLISLEPELYNQLRGLQKSARELRKEVRVLRRLSQLQSMAMKDLVNDTYLKLREACINFASQTNKGEDETSLENIKTIEDQDFLVHELNELLGELSKIEINVEDMRSGVINKKNKISIQDVENMALLLSRSSKTVSELQRKLPIVQKNLTCSLPTDVNEQEKMKNKFEKEVPDKLESAWKRCKKVTGTLVTLKRLASVQEQRVHPGAPIDISLSPTPSEIARLPTGADIGKESSLDDLLDALQNYSNSEGSNPDSGCSDVQDPEKSSIVPEVVVTSSLKAPLARLPSYPSTEVASPMKQITPQTKPPPCPPRNQRRAPPPPPPRTSSTGSRVVSKESEDAPYSKPIMPSPSPAYINTKMVVNQTAASSLTRTVSADQESPRRLPISQTISDPGGWSNIRESDESQAQNNLESDSIYDNINATSLTGNSRNTNRGAGTNMSLSRSESSSSESVNSQDGGGVVMGVIIPQSQIPPPVPLKPDAIKNLTNKTRQDALEQRHQELLTRQRQLQEQYQRLQVMQKKANNMTAASSGVIRESASSLNKTGSDSSLTNIAASDSNSTPANRTNTLPHIPTKPIPTNNTKCNTLPNSNTTPTPKQPKKQNDSQSSTPKKTQKLEQNQITSSPSNPQTTTSKIYETDIL